MTDLTPSPEAVEAAAKAIWNVPPIREGRCSWEQFDEQAKRGTDKLRAQATAALAAALPHLRPLVEAQELRLATEVALKLGRQEAAEEIAQAITERLGIREDCDCGECDVALCAVNIARDTGKGDSA